MTLMGSRPPIDCVQTSRLPARSVAYAIRFPSGDHDGSFCKPESNVNCQSRFAGCPKRLPAVEGQKAATAVIDASENAHHGHRHRLNREAPESAPVALSRE